MLLITKYFPLLSDSQRVKIQLLYSIYESWNSKINLISRKDFENIYLHHVLHSLAIAKFIQFRDNTTILDVGTGGGFPGIPLAILFPNCKFHLIDSIGKKIKVVEDVKNQLRLNNVTSEQIRVEKLNAKYDFIVSRAVTTFPDFVKITRKNIKQISFNIQKNGIIYLKGGNLEHELEPYKNVEIINVKDFFEEDFFETKKIVYLTTNSY
ncbi:MAG: 16S rRNA (guanine(527)-N(7))-methyltransferase [Bacteroidetes bacterium GWA2_30_7]|nr:MAG: 16S rRNA (guanine(527)-N(7))-methyltransferase [Bacteroidetes bacterium GWA2_30_7]